MLVKNMKIMFTHKLIGSYFLVVFIPILCLSFYNFTVERQAAINEAIVLLNESSQKMASDIDKYLIVSKNIINHLAINSDLKGFLMEHAPDDKKIDAITLWLRAQSAVSSDYSAVFVLNMDGICVASSESSFISHNYAVRDYFREAAKGVTFKSDWSIGLTSKEPGIYLSAPIMHGNTVLGVIVLKLRVSQITTLVSFWRHQGRDAFLINNDGIILSHTRSEYDYRSIIELSSEAKERIKEDYEFLDKEILPLGIQQVQSALQMAISKRDTQTVSYYFQNEKRIASLTPLMDANWVVGISMSVNDADILVNRIMKNSILFTIISLAICLFIGIIMGRIISRPISQLTDAVNRFGEGQSDARASIQSKDEIGLLATSFNHLADIINEHTNTLEEEVRNRTQELEHVNAELKALSIIDPLTGCYNRRFMLERLEIETDRAKRYGHYLAVILCDLDHFKCINDIYGHQAGDKTLEAFAHLLQQSIRRNVDWLVRYGGEEFLLILPETDLEGAMVLAERLRVAFENLRVVLPDGQEVRCTASFGTTAVNFSQSKMAVAPDLIFAAADELLYLAKESGRNMVFFKEFHQLSLRSSCRVA